MSEIFCRCSDGCRNYFICDLNKKCMNVSQIPPPPSSRPKWAPQEPKFSPPPKPPIGKVLYQPWPGKLCSQCNSSLERYCGGALPFFQTGRGCINEQCENWAGAYRRGRVPLALEPGQRFVPYVVPIEATEDDLVLVQYEELLKPEQRRFIIEAFERGRESRLFLVDGCKSIVILRNARRKKPNREYIAGMKGEEEEIK